MSRWGFVGFAAVLLSNLASAEPMSLAPLDPDDGQTPPTVVTARLQQQAPPDRGFFEQLFGNGAPPSRRGSQQWYGPPPEQNDYRGYGNADVDPRMDQERYDGRMDPRFLWQEVAYDGREAPGTVVIDTRNHFLYLVEGEGRAIRYGIGVGRPGFTWSGTHAISAKKQWPDWTPPDEMLMGQPYLPHLLLVETEQVDAVDLYERVKVGTKVVVL